MKLKYFLLLTLCSVFTTSCLSLALRSLGAYEKDANMFTYTNGVKTVAYVPMKHIGPKEFYANVKQKVDSLQAQGYIVYMEGVKPDDSLTKPQTDTLMFKIRKITGITMSKQGYIDTINSTIMGHKFKNRHDLVNQPRYYKMGVDTLTARIADITFAMMVNGYEKRYGKLLLNECDFNTRMDAKYTCSSEPLVQANEFILDYRNKYLAKTITEDTHTKIAILYGAKHEEGLYKELKAIDKTWAQTKK